jgi:ribosomal protein S12 methylthiotransferase accessory factor
LLAPSPGAAPASPEDPLPGATARPGRTGKRYRLGTHRVRPPEETWAAIEPLFPRVGITRVADVTRLDRLGIPVFQAVRPAGWSLAVSQGKGVTAAAARTSAAMEAIELWCCEDLSRLPQAELPLREMAYANPVPAAALRRRPGAPVLDALPIPWLRARSLAGGPPAWLPRQMLELDLRLPGAYAPRMFRPTSNGLASGNCPEEAQLHALCELVERHALALAHREPSRKVALDLATVPAGYARDLVELLRRAGARLAVYDLTWEAGLPALYAELALDDLPRRFHGSGCHPSPEVALARALSEAAQSRLTFISGARDDLPEPEPPRPPGAAHAAFAEPAAGRPFGALEDLATDSVAADLAETVRRLVALGHEPYAVDLTRVELGIAVVKAFAPGLLEAHDA